MSARHLGIAKGIFAGRTFGFIISIDDAKNRIFFPLPADNDFKNGELVSYEVAFDWQGRRYAREVKRAVAEEVEHLYQVGFVMDYNPGTDSGHVVDGGANYWRFRGTDLDDSITTLFEGDDVLFVPNVSERKARFALSIRKPN